MKYTEAQITSYLDGIFDGTINTDNLPEDLYFAISDHLKEGLYKGFGKDLSQADGKDLALLAELRDNVYMFGAAKTYQETKAISAKLLDEDGNIRSRSSFLEEGRKMFDNWNDNYGRTEYNTAIGSGTMAVKWNDIQDRKYLFPNLRYSTIGDACPICEPLDGLTAPADDPVWETIYPLNHFNCMCTVLQEDEDATLTPPEDIDAIMDQVKPEMSDLFMNNVGITGSVFPADHPYFTVPKEDKDLAERNFDLPIPPASEEAGKFVFAPASTIPEALERIQATGVAKVSLPGMKLDEVNAVLHAFEKEATFGKMNLGELGIVRRPKARYDAFYQPGTRDEIKINLPVMRKTTLSETGIPFTWEEKITRFEKRIKDLEDNYLGNPRYKQTDVTRNLYNFKQAIAAAKEANKAGEISRAWTVSDLATNMSDKILRTTLHELGHYRHLNTLKLRSAYMDPRFKFTPIGSITDYGATNFKEYFAEWFTQYREFGPGGIPDDILKLFNEIK